ncbi:MAG: protease pro-enzyme activation domain-containing protein [Solirubrobacteraceae bacterium]
MSAPDRVQIPGSERKLDPEHNRVGDVDQQAEIDVTVYLRPRDTLGWVDAEATRPAAERRRPSREEWAERYGARPEDIDAVVAFANQHRLAVTGIDAARRSIGLHGTVDAVAAAFAARFEGLYAAAGGAQRYRGRSGALTVPADLDGVVTGVFGIDDRPQAAKHLRMLAATALATTSYTPPQVAQAYAFPTGVTGAG